MSRLALLALLLAACGTAQAKPVAAPVAKPVSTLEVAKAFTYRVQIECGKGEPMRPGGTAVDIGHGALVTARHVVEGDEDCVFVLDQGDNVLKYATWTKKDPDHDIALLYSPDLEQANSAGASLCEPQLGDELIAVGYPRGPNDRIQRLSVTTGVVSSEGWGEGEVRITAPIYFGNSGGGAWNRRGSCLTGVTVSGFMQMDGWYFIVPAQLVAALMK